MEFGTLLVAGLAQGAMYALVALGLVIVYKTQDAVNFAHGEVLMVGAFLAYILVVYAGLSYWAALLVVIPVMALFGGLIERVFIRRVAAESHITIAMVTVGLSFALQGAARIPFGSDIYSFPPPWGDAGPVRIAGALVAVHSLVIIAVMAVVAIALAVIFARTKIGKMMRATQQSLVGARIVGINPGSVFMMTWAFSAAMAAAAGVLAGPMYLLYPDMGAKLVLKGFAAAVLGGFNSVLGAIVGGIIIGIAEILAGAFIATTVQDVSSFFVIIVVLLLRPQGIFGRKEAARV